MTLYGLLPTGYAPKPQTVIRDEISSSMKALRGPSFDMTDGSLMGQWGGILSTREASIWDLIQAVVSSRDPNKATDAQQDNVCALTGTFRRAARSSSVTATLTGTPTTVVPDGTTFKTASTGALFSSVGAATITGLATWVDSTTYTAGQRVTNFARCYICTIGGIASLIAGTGPSTTGSAIVDGSVTWAYLGEGTGAVDVLALSVVKDAITCNAGDLTGIQTPVGGLSNVSNLANATLGAPKQSNASLRVTREAELAASGTSPADSIRAAILKVAGVTACTVFGNLTDVIDGNGQAPHSVQALVQGGDSTAIATVLLANVAFGIVTVGTTTVNVADSTGTLQPISFTRVTSVPIYVDATYTYNSAPVTKGGYPATGDALAKTALAAFGNALGGGRDVVSSSLAAALFPLFAGGAQLAGVQGILDVTSVKISTAPGPTLTTTIVITPFQLATFAEANITIHSAVGSL